MMIVQNNLNIILYTNNNKFIELRDSLIKFSELKQASDDIYIFQITDLSIWNALSNEITIQSIFDVLKNNSQYPIKDETLSLIENWKNSYGILKLRKYNDRYFLLEIPNNFPIQKIKQYLIENNGQYLIEYYNRGEIKSICMQLGFPINDTIGYSTGEKLNVSLKENIKLRPYQQDACDLVYQAGNGIVIHACGSGKTLVGLGMMKLSSTKTLIVTNTQSSVNQWKREILSKTNIPEDKVSTFGDKHLAPITIVTYNMITYRQNKEFKYLKEFLNYNFGLIIMDECHKMPSQMFRMLCSMQSLKRMALTASFIREDNREKDIFTLVGPIRHYIPWKDMEAKGFIAKLNFQELRCDMDEISKNKYINSHNGTDKFEIASKNKKKIDLVGRLLKENENEKILIMGHFPDQLKEISERFGLEMVYGNTPNKERDILYDKLRTGKINVLLASSVANAAIDIPCVSLCIEVSGFYGSQSESVQRAGRISRPKEIMSRYIKLCSKGTVEEMYSLNRQKYLTKEGYRYEIKEI